MLQKSSEERMRKEKNYTSVHLPFLGKKPSKNSGVRSGFEKALSLHGSLVMKGYIPEGHIPCTLFTQEE